MAFKCNDAYLPVQENWLWKQDIPENSCTGSTVSLYWNNPLWYIYDTPINIINFVLMVSWLYMYFNKDVIEINFRNISMA